MALIKLNIDSLKKDSKGILDKLVDQVVNKIEDKLENAVDDLFAKALKGVGLSDNIARQLSSRFGDAFSTGVADKYFQSSTSEQNRVSQQEICEVLPRSGAETAGDAVARIGLAVDIGMDKAPVFQYPSRMGKYYFSMKFATYVRPAPQVKAKLQFKEAFVLPLPRELKESFDIQVSPKEQGLVGGIADAATAYFTTGGGEKYNVAKSAETLLLSKLVQMAGEFGDYAGQTLGAVPNPHVSAIFSGIGLRTHRFEWTFAPRNAEESRQLQTLIFKLKANALPSYSTNGTAALQYPQLVQIDLYPWANDGEANKLIRFKPCILNDVGINYSPQGIPSFFAGTKQPTFIQLSLDFLETEIWTGMDYDRAGEDRIQEAKGLIDKIMPGSVAAFENTVNDIFTVASNVTPGGDVPTAARTDSPSPSVGKAQTTTKQRTYTAADVTTSISQLNANRSTVTLDSVDGGKVTIQYVYATGGAPIGGKTPYTVPYGGYIATKISKDGKSTRIATSSNAADMGTKLAGQVF